MVTVCQQAGDEVGPGLLPLSVETAGHGKHVLKGHVDICAKLGANTRDFGVSPMS